MSPHAQTIPTGHVPVLVDEVVAALLGRQVGAIPGLTAHASYKLHRRHKIAVDGVRAGNNLVSLRNFSRPVARINRLPTDFLFIAQQTFDSGLLGTIVLPSRPPRVLVARHRNSRTGSASCALPYASNTRGASEHRSDY